MALLLPVKPEPVLQQLPGLLLPGQIPLNLLGLFR